MFGWKEIKENREAINELIDKTEELYLDMGTLIKSVKTLLDMFEPKEEQIEPVDESAGKPANNGTVGDGTEHGGPVSEQETKARGQGKRNHSGLRQRGRPRKHAS